MDVLLFVNSLMITLNVFKTRMDSLIVLSITMESMRTTRILLKLVTMEISLRMMDVQQLELLTQAINASIPLVQSPIATNVEMASGEQERLVTMETLITLMDV